MRTTPATISTGTPSAIGPKATAATAASSTAPVAVAAPMDPSGPPKAGAARTARVLTAAPDPVASFALPPYDDERTWSGGGNFRQRENGAVIGARQRAQ